MTRIRTIKDEIKLAWYMSRFMPGPSEWPRNYRNWRRVRNASPETITRLRRYQSHLFWLEMRKLTDLIIHIGTAATAAAEAFNAVQATIHKER